MKHMLDKLEAIRVPKQIQVIDALPKGTTEVGFKITVELPSESEE